MAAFPSLDRVDRARDSVRGVVVRGVARAAGRVWGGALEAGTTVGGVRRGVLGWFVRSGLRRVAALVVLALLAVSHVEALVADVHDGDATHAELVQADGAARHGAAHGTGHHDDASHAGAAGGNAAADVLDVADTDGAPGHGHVPGHPYHACHHAHAHADAAWCAAVRPLSVALVAVRTPTPAARAQAPRSRAAEPEIRPPIA